MTGYEIYCFCRSLQKRKSPSIETFENSSEKNYFLMLESTFKTYSLDSKEIKNFILAIYNNNADCFNPYELHTENSKAIYTEWKKKYETVADYYQEILNGITFIENFCIKNNLTFEEYCYKYGMVHTREKRFDWVISVKYNMVVVEKLKTIEKILLKNYLSKYNIIKSRLLNQELDGLIEGRVRDMKQVLKVIK